MQYPENLDDFVARQLEPGETARRPYLPAETYPRFWKIPGFLAPRWFFRKVWLVLTDRRLLVIRAKYWSMEPMHVWHSIDRPSWKATWAGRRELGYRLFLHFNETAQRMWLFASKKGRRGSVYPSGKAYHAMLDQDWRNVVDSLVSAGGGAPVVLTHHDEHIFAKQVRA